MRNRGRGARIIIPHMTRPRFLFPLSFIFAAATAFADFHLQATPSHVPAADGDARLRVEVVNATPSVAANVELNYSDLSRHIVPVPGDGWACSDTVSVTCKLLHPLAAGASAPLDLRFHFDGPYGRRELTFGAIGDLGGTIERSFLIAGAALYRRFTVNRTADSGDGSLRAAVEALNADAICADLPCAIDFDIVPSAGHTIALQSPLPRITAYDVLVDGGGSMAVDGAAAGNANGLDFDGVRGEVAGVTIRNFGDNAILLRLRRRATPFDPSPRLVVSNSVIEGNFRGITFGPGWLGRALISDCKVINNVRSGIFDWSEHDPGFPLEPVMRIERNRIAGNGASGIFLGEGSDGALLDGNVIEGNRDFGVAVARGARSVRLLANSIAHNGHAAIDVGLDGPSPVVASPSGNRDAAVIQSATYDPATNTTTIAGLPSVRPIGVCDFCGTFLVSLYANDAAEHGEYAEAQQYLGEAQPNGLGFVFTFNGDLRGKYITALATRWLNLVGSDLFDTGELSKAVLVH